MVGLYLIRWGNCPWWGVVLEPISFVSIADDPGETAWSSKKSDGWSRRQGGRRKTEEDRLPGSSPSDAPARQELHAEGHPRRSRHLHVWGIIIIIQALYGARIQGVWIIIIITSALAPATYNTQCIWRNTFLLGIPNYYTWVKRDNCG